jgi:hypothetical protein
MSAARVPLRAMARAMPAIACLLEIARSASSVRLPRQCLLRRVWIGYPFPECRDA